MAFRPHPDQERRKQSWPKEWERLPREPGRYAMGGRRPESTYSTETTELTASLERIRLWGENSETNHRKVARELPELGSPTAPIYEYYSEEGICFQSGVSKA